VISHRDTHVLLDCGFGYRDAVTRLARLGLTPDALAAIVVTHEHSDHWGGVAALAGQHDLPVYASRGTWIEVRGHTLTHTVEMRGDFQVGEILVRPVTVPHDAREPVQCVFESDGQRLGVLSDLGSVSQAVVAAFRELDALSVEFNHDLDMLWAGPYPEFLKTRVGGDYGHLNNVQAAQLVQTVRDARLHTVVACHVSETNNTPECVGEALERALNGSTIERIVASQADGLDWMHVGQQ
jgi:phosphoribosyl 1,2-cyclic phosphodiesterase